MINYATYEIEDLVQDDYFISWVKYPDPGSDDFFSEFLLAYPSKKETLRQAKLLVTQLADASAMKVNAGEAEQIWSGIQLKISKNQDRKNLSIVWIKWVAAACILLIGGLLFWKENALIKSPSLYESLTGDSDASLQEVANTSAKPMIIKLPDGSIVSLQKESRLSYVKNFNGKQRKVFLSGAAFFEVTKNREKPFLVYANGLVTRVLGTSFSISAYEYDQHVNVTVKTGKVSVFKNTKGDLGKSTSEPVILAPNQQVTYSRASGIIKKALVADPQRIIPAAELSYNAFVDASLPGIFRALEQVYGVEIIFDESSLSSCHLTTTFGQETLFDRLDIICEAIGGTYEVVDAKIVISAKKCD